MLAMVDIHTWDTDKNEKLTREVWAQLREAIPQLQLREWKEDQEKRPNIYGSDVLIDLATDGPLLSAYDIEFKVKRFKNTYIASTKSRYLSTQEERRDVSNIHLHIPNIGLLVIDELQLLEDACTDELQGQLDKGWRIVAICPPNSARRPDYILGRTKGQDQ